mmetsp:Transcript_23332/g.71473  ORF Transcript_23332/g.71473 Transcript_23332/m.71473 type:complete len:324 (+) Transcript_23332:1181-2152(+)
MLQDGSLLGSEQSSLGSRFQPDLSLLDHSRTSVVGQSVATLPFGHRSVVPGLESNAYSAAHGTCSSIDGNATACTAAVDGAGLNFSCRARALNSIGSSPWSHPLRVQTLKATVPAAPGGATLSWSDPLRLLWKPAEERGSHVAAYEVQAIDWWIQKMGWAIIYNGSQPNLDLRELPLPAPLHPLRLLPAVPYPLRVRALSALGPSLWGPTTNLTLPKRGGCNGTDIKLFRDVPASAKAGIQSALISCIASTDRRACARLRIERKVGLSPECATCWVTEGFCTLQKCALECLNPQSGGCAECSHSKCFPACVLCTGIPEWSFPP